MMRLENVLSVESIRRNPASASSHSRESHIHYRAIGGRGIYWASDVEPRESGSSLGRGRHPNIYRWCAKGGTRSGEVGGKDGEGTGV